MSQMENTQLTAADMLPGQSAALLAKFFYRELDGKLVPLYTKDDFVTAGLSRLGSDELLPQDIRTMQELVYPPRHVKTEETSSLADIPHQASVTPTPARPSAAPSAHIEHRTYQPTTAGSLGVKKYCTHWLRTGECDFNQQGCLFEHVIPDEETMFGTLGFKTIPRWIRESGHFLPFAKQDSTPPAPTPPATERSYGPPSTSGPPNMYMGRQMHQGRPVGQSATGGSQRYSSSSRSTVGPSTNPRPAQGYQNPRPTNVGGFRASGGYRPACPKSNIPAYTNVVPQTSYAGRGDMPSIDRSVVPSPAPSDYSIASNNSFMQWQPTSLPARPMSSVPSFTSNTPALTPSGGYSSNSSPGTMQAGTPTGTGPQQSSGGIFMPGNSAIFGAPRAPVPHIEHRKMFAGKKEGGPKGKGVKGPEKEEGEVTEEKGDLVNF